MPELAALLSVPRLFGRLVCQWSCVPMAMKGPMVMKGNEGLWLLQIEN